MRAAYLRVVVLLIAAGLLSGCVTAKTGAEFAVIMPKVGPPPAGHARIVVLSEAAGGGYADITIDGVAARKVTPGTWIYADRRAGKHKFLGTQSLFPGETNYEMPSATAAGLTYFVVARESSRSRLIGTSGMSGGLAGGLVATAFTAGMDNVGPVEFLAMDDATARTALASLQLAE